MFIDYFKTSFNSVLESVLKRNPNHTGLDYLESPDFYFPTRESLGSVLLAKGDYREFKKVSPLWAFSIWLAGTKQT